MPLPHPFQSLAVTDPRNGGDDLQATTDDPAGTLRSARPPRNSATARRSASGKGVPWIRILPFSSALRIASGLNCRSAATLGALAGWGPSTVPWHDAQFTRNASAPSCAAFGRGHPRHRAATPARDHERPRIASTPPAARLINHEPRRSRERLLCHRGTRSMKAQSQREPDALRGSPTIRHVLPRRSRWLTSGSFQKSNCALIFAKRASRTEFGLPQVGP